MKKQVLRGISIAMIMLLTGCAGSRVVKNTIGEEPGKTPKGSLVQFSQKAPPAANVVQESVAGTLDQLWPATLAVLKQEGFEIDNQDEKNGTFRTRRKSLQLDTSYCVYGTAADPRSLNEQSVTYVTFYFKVEDNAIAIRTDVKAVTLMGGQMKELDVICVSLGKLEKELLAKIREMVKNKP